MRLPGKKLLWAAPLAWLAGCSVGQFTGLGYHERVISLQPSHALTVADRSDDGLLLAADREQASGPLSLRGEGISTADLRRSSDDPEQDRLIQLSALRRRFSRSVGASQPQAEVQAVTGEVQSNGWDKIYQGRRESRRGRTVARSESRTARPDRATLAEIERVAKAAEEEAARIEQAADTEAEIAERRLLAEAELAERIAEAQSQLAERLAAAQAERDLRVEAAQAERDLRLGFLGIDMQGKDGANLSRKIDTLDRRSTTIAQPGASRLGLSKVAGLFRGNKPVEPKASSAEELAKSAASSAADLNGASEELAEPSIAEMAAALAPEESTSSSSTLARTGNKIEFSFGPAEFPESGASAATEQLHPSLLELPIAPAQAAPAVVAQTETVEPKPAPPVAIVAEAQPTKPSQGPAWLGRGPEADAWILGRSEDELIPSLPSTDLLGDAAAAKTSEPALLSSVVDVTPKTEVWPQEFPGAVGSSGGLFADDLTVILPAVPAAEAGLLAGTSSGLLEDAFQQAGQTPLPTSDPWTFATDVSQPASQAESFPIAVAETPSPEAALPVAAVSQPARVVQAAPVAPLPRLIDVCGPLPLQVKSLVLQLDIPEAGIRKEVLADLAALGEKARPALPAIEVLLDDDPLIAAHAAWTMWEIDHNDGAVIEKMVRLMQCGRTDVVQFAAYSLGSMEANALTAAPALRVERERHTGITRLHIAEAMTRIDAFDTASVEVMVGGLTSSNQSERWLAAIALGQVQSRHANLVVPALTASLKDTDPEVRSASALSLGGFGKAAEPAMAELRNRATLDAPSVREAAATALACIQRKDASKTVW